MDLPIELLSTKNMNALYNIVFINNLDIPIDLLSTKNRHILNMQKLQIDELEVIGRYRYNQVFRKLPQEKFETMYEIVYVESGRQKYHIEDKIITLHGGELLIIRANTAHSTGNFYEERGVLYWIIGKIFIPTFFGHAKNVGEHIIQTLLSVASRPIKVTDSFKEILHSIFKIYSLYSKSKNSIEKDLFRTKIVNKLLELYLELYDVCKIVMTHKVPDKRIQRCVDYINKNITKAIQVQYLASELAYMSLPHFKRTFKKETGMPPKEYINHKKILTAKSLLRKGMNVTETAFELGFSTSQYFATTFLKFTNMQPSYYKNTKKL